MTDVALVALITSTATVLVAVTAAVANYFGAGRQERIRVAAEQEAAVVARRFARAEEFAEAMILAANAERWKHRTDVTRAWARFAATLRAGEGPVADYGQRMMERVISAQALDAVKIAAEASDRIFSWLRGEVTPAEMEGFAAAVR